ncbi:MAG TPA: Hsp20/alpha crystallin family protein [Planctomycetaceae bacterium]|nr:Hsp20/alpha crystallin family protein [Planctomycetaceae bacterium]
MTTLSSYGTRYPDLFEEFRREMDRVMSRFFESGEGTAEYYRPPCNVAETEKSFEILVDLPGVNPEQVDVELRHGELWIAGERPTPAGQEGWTWHRQECPAGKFRRIIRLGGDVDAERIEAQYRNGTLHITVPKSESARTKRITVKA